MGKQPGELRHCICDTNPCGFGTTEKELPSPSTPYSYPTPHICPSSPHCTLQMVRASAVKVGMVGVRVCVCECVTRREAF